MLKKIIYLHGFNSSPSSIKAVQLKQYLGLYKSNWGCWIPSLPIEPDKLVELCENYIIEHIEKEEIFLIGSSLGGFYAIYLAEKYNLKCIVLNPAIHPDNYISEYKDVLVEKIGKYEQSGVGAYIKIINSLKVRSISKPEHFMLLAQKGDELIDYKIAQKYFSKAIIDIEENGSHNFDGFEHKLPQIFEFLG